MGQPEQGSGNSCRDSGAFRAMTVILWNRTRTGSVPLTSKAATKCQGLVYARKTCASIFLFNSSDSSHTTTGNKILKYCTQCCCSVNSSTIRSHNLAENTHCEGRDEIIGERVHNIHTRNTHENRSQIATTMTTATATKKAGNDGNDKTAANGRRLPRDCSGGRRQRLRRH